MLQRPNVTCTCAHVRRTCKHSRIRQGVLRCHVSAIPVGATASRRQGRLRRAPQVPQYSLESAAEPSAGTWVPCRTPRTNNLHKHVM